MSTPTLTASTRSRSGAQDHRHVVRAHEPADVGRHVDPRVGGEVRARGRGPGRPSAHRRGRDERRLGELPGRAGPAAGGAWRCCPRCSPRRPGRARRRRSRTCVPTSSSIPRRTTRGELLGAARVARRVGEPADDVLAVGDLGVHRSPRPRAPRRSRGRSGSPRSWSCPRSTARPTCVAARAPARPTTSEPRTRSVDVPAGAPEERRELAQRPPGPRGGGASRGRWSPRRCTRSKSERASWSDGGSACARYGADRGIDGDRPVGPHDLEPLVR